MLDTLNRTPPRMIYHFTSINNLPSIFKFGLLAPSELARRGLVGTSLAWEGLRKNRAETVIPLAPGGKAEDYVPLYFSQLSPMLLMILNNKSVDEDEIVHFEFPLRDISRSAGLYTDAAIFPGSFPHYFTGQAGWNALDWHAIDSTAWQMPSYQARLARMAEFLVWKGLPLSAARRIIVWDAETARRVRQMAAEEGFGHLPIEADPASYFIEPETAPLVPAVLGPHGIWLAYQKTLAAITQATAQPREQPRFPSLEALHQALWDDLACLPETAELVGLETDNRAHKEDVGSHTRRVVVQVTRMPEYQPLDPHFRLVLEVAAFLHDIGKGPKSRWAAHNGRQQIDFNHPVKALPMLQRILSQEIASLFPEDARLICLLVTYHDLIGGILFSGRRLEELLRLVQSPLELDLLAALSKADALAINPDWGEPVPRDALKARVARIKNW